MLIKTRFGSEQEILLDEVLRQGQDTAFNICVRARDMFSQVRAIARDVLPAFS